MPRPAGASLERIIPLYLALGIAAFGLLQVAAAALVVSSRFSDLEIADLEGHRDQFRVLIERETEALKSITKSYAEWMDSYDYMMSRDQSFVRDNFSLAWMESQRIDVVLLVSSDGEPLWSITDKTGLDQMLEPATPGSRDPALFPADYGHLPPKPVVGFAEYEGSPALYVSWPVTDDLGTLPPRGLLLFGRVLTPELLDAFAPGKDFSISYGADGAADLGAASDVRIEYSSAGTVLAAYDSVLDPLGDPIGHFRYHKERAWMRAAYSLMAWFAFLVAASGFGAYMVASIVVKRRMVRPILEVRDYLDKFAESFIAESRLELGHGDELGELASHVNALVDKVERQTRELDKLACTDGLTGLPNRRSLDTTLARLELKARVERNKREERSALKRGSVACALLDVDFFKIFNDLYGHAEGDEALKRIAGAIRACAMRPGDLPSRYGGEEFAIVLPETDEAGAVAVLERVRAAVERLGIKHAGSLAAPVITISAGVAAVASSRSDMNLAALMDLADKAMYAAKASGRNRVVAASSLNQDRDESIRSS